jgi:hypothetical protein
MLNSYILYMLADTVFSLILGPDMHRDLRGEVCLRQSSNPLKYNIRHHVCQLCDLNSSLGPSNPGILEP